MADVLLIFISVLLVIAGGFVVYYVRAADKRLEKTRLKRARLAALAEREATAEYIRKVDEAETVEELERLAEEREE